MECVKSLILSGANLNACTPSHTSALFIASYIGHTACVQVLLQAGALPTTGSSCRECALQRGFPKISKLLERHPPACVPGFIFDSSAFFNKWLSCFFVVSVSQGTVVAIENLRDITRAAASVMRLDARNCRFTQPECFEGKDGVLRILWASSTEVSFFPGCISTCLHTQF